MSGDKEIKEYSNKLDLLGIFKDMPEYVVMRVSDVFPNYYANTDVDVLCVDVGACVGYLSELGFKETWAYEWQFHMDHVIDGELDFRFDLYGGYISPEFKKDVFMYKRMSTEHGVYVPWEPLNLASKYYEYKVRWKEKHSRFERYKNILDGYYTI